MGQTRNLQIFVYIESVSINAQWSNPVLWRHSQSQLQLHPFDVLCHVILLREEFRKWNILL